jgi:hypothetical protein
MDTNASRGCSRCFQGDASAVWAARPFEHVATLVDDVHFIIHLMRCSACRQPCIKIFSEEVDFANGDDAQTWIVIPLTADESENLRTQGEAVSIKEIETLSTGRRCLVVDYPSGGEKSCWWRDGPLGILRR